MAPWTLANSSCCSSHNVPNSQQPSCSRFAPCLGGIWPKLQLLVPPRSFVDADQERAFLHRRSLSLQNSSTAMSALCAVAWGIQSNNMYERDPTALIVRWLVLPVALLNVAAQAGWAAFQYSKRHKPVPQRSRTSAYVWLFNLVTAMAIVMLYPPDHLPMTAYHTVTAWYGWYLVFVQFGVATGEALYLHLLNMEVSMLLWLSSYLSGDSLRMCCLHFLMDVLLSFVAPFCVSSALERRERELYLKTTAGQPKRQALGSSKRLKKPYVDVVRNKSLKA